MHEAKESNFISAVVYVHNQEKSIEGFLIMLYGAFQKHFEKFEIICVNDGSDDGSTQIIRDTAKAFDGDCVTTIVNMSYFQGLEVAMNTGVNFSIGDFVYEFDHCVVDYQPALIFEAYRHALADGYDVVSVSNSRQRLLSWAFYRLYNGISNTQHKLQTETFRILSRRAINRIQSLNQMIPYRKAIYANSGLKTDRMRYASTDQEAKNEEKLQRKKDVETAMTSLVLFTNLAYRVSIVMASSMMAATLAGVIYTVIIFFLGKPVAGYTTTMLLVAASFFGVFAILSMIIRYLSILVNLLFKKNNHIIESIEKIAK